MADVPTSPLVATSATRLLDTISASQLCNDWKHSLGIDISDELRGIEEISLHRCLESQLDFFTPPSAAGSEQLYQKLRNNDWFYMSEKWEFEQAIEDLAGYTRILEVGCGPGLFMERAARRLKRSSIKGTETNDTNVKEALRKNLDVERVDLNVLAARGETYDAVCSFQVLEHVTDPRDFLSAMMEVLVPGGRLILVVPNKDGYLRYLYSLLDMPPHHMTRWNTFTFKYLEKLFPLEIIRIRFEPLARYHISEYVIAYGQFWRARLPGARRWLSWPNLLRMAGLLERSGLYGFLRGHSLYGLFKKL